MMGPRILAFGAGYSVQAFARDKPAAAQISGTTRSPEKFERLEEAGIRPLLWTGDRPPALLDALGDATHLVISVAPGETGDPVLAALRSDILSAARNNLRWIGYLSTVGVYGDHGGAWIDEETPCAPRSRRSVERVHAEEEWRALGREAALPVALLRLSGIYGPGRNAFLNLEHGTARRLVKPGQVFNRIHVADIAGALWHLLQQGADGPFNVTDDEPAPPQDVVEHAARLMGIEPPPAIPFETSELSPMQRSFYGENKRVSNARLKSLGYRFRFPYYRAALRAMWDDRSWRGMGDTDRRSPIAEN